LTQRVADPTTTRGRNRVLPSQVRKAALRSYPHRLIPEGKDNGPP
jgi:hypothetical protein